MKIYSDYDKKLRDFYAVERNHRRGYKLYLFLAFSLSIVSIILLINYLNNKSLTNLIYFIVSIVACILFLLAGLFRMYIFNGLSKKKPLFNEILNLYKDKKLISLIANYGIDKANLDSIIVPNGYITIAYIYDKYCYIEASVERGVFSFKKEVTTFVKQNSEAKTFDKYLKKKYGKTKTINSKGYNSIKFIEEFVSYINDNDLEELSNLSKLSIEESKKILR